MSQNEIDAVAISVARERREAETRVAALRSEARSLGETFSAIGLILQSEPEYLMFEKMTQIDARYRRQNERLVKVEQIDGSRLFQLTNDLRATLVRLERLQQEGAKLGV